MNNFQAICLINYSAYKITMFLKCNYMGRVVEYMEKEFSFFRASFRFYCLTYYVRQAQQCFNPIMWH
jgi:hypothetical protein